MATSIVLEPLNKKNYENWRACMESYLMSQDLWKVVEYDEDETPAPTPEGNITDYEGFKRKDATALHSIRVSCSQDILAKIRGKTSAKDAWCALAVMNNHSTILSKHEKEQQIAAGDRHFTRALATALFKAIIDDNLDYIEKLFNKHQDLVKAKLFQKGYTALHLAVTSNKLKAVEELLKRMSVEDMKIQDGSGNTALGLAVFNGGTEMIPIVDCLVKKSPELLVFKDKMGLPLAAACIGGHKDMIYHMYFRTGHMLTEHNKSRLSEDDAAFVLRYFISFRCLDIALELLHWCEKLGYRKPIIAAVSEFSFEPSAFPSGTRLHIWERLIYNCLKVNLRTTASRYNDNDVGIAIDDQEYQDEKKNIIVKQEQSCGLAILLKFFGIKHIYDLKETHVYTKELLRLMSKALVDFDNAEIWKCRAGNKTDPLHDAIFRSAKSGITETIVEIISKNPDFLWCTDIDGRSIFHIAVLHRQHKVFSLIYGIGALKHQRISSLDKDRNSMLHLAGKSAPQRLFDQVHGAALLMQRELQWFQEVESIVPLSFGRATNIDDNETPYEVFDKNHKELIEQGEKWIKGIAQSSTVVGTLITTIMFSGLYSIGGKNQDTSPGSLPGKVFRLFIISDAISLSASSTSVLMFLSILTSRYAAKDFLKPLPTKLIIALFSLFISITTMMIAFCSAVFIVLKGQLSFVIPIVVVASIPVFTFGFSQFPLLLTVFHSTYGPGIFDRKMKQWL